VDNPRKGQGERGLDAGGWERDNAFCDVSGGVGADMPAGRMSGTGVWQMRDTQETDNRADGGISGETGGGFLSGTESVQRVQDAGRQKQNSEQERLLLCGISNGRLDGLQMRGRVYWRSGFGPVLRQWDGWGCGGALWSAIYWYRTESRLCETGAEADTGRRREIWIIKGGIK